jgi:histidinol-phosphate aminotransferase
MARALGERGVEVTPSQANFLWLKAPRPAGDVFHELASRGVLVRSFHGSGGRLAGQLRVTLGTPAENDELLRCLGEIL